jgi:glycine cleavage system H protein
MDFPKDLRYTAEHEWIRQDGEMVVVGITDHAQLELGDVVYVELPEVGSRISQGSPLGVIESVKAASDLFAPVSGEVVAVNGDLEGAPQLVNESPYGHGWIITVRPSRLDAEDAQLLDAEAYAQLVQSA